MNGFERAPGGWQGDGRRRRGRRGGGGGGAPFAGPRPAPGRPAPPPGHGEEDEASLQARELAAYERRERMQQQRRTGWRPPSIAPSIGRMPQAGRPGGPPARGGFGGRPPQPWRGGQRGGRGRTAGFQEAVRRVQAGPPRSAPSHDAGEPIAGPHAVLEAIRAGRGVRKLYVSQDRSTRTGTVNELIAEAQQRRIFVNYVDRLEVARLSPLEDHQGVVAIVEGRPGVDLEELLLQLGTVEGEPLVLVIDQLQDPQNFGVLLRSAEGAGVDGVVIPRHRQVGMTAAVARTSAGASEHLLIADVANVRQAVDALKEKGVWVVAADESGDLLYDEVDYRGPTAIVIGSEGEGIRRLVLEGADEVVRIPMEGRVSSLNAASAGTVILYEALRQRRRDAAPPGTRTPRPERPAAEDAAGRSVPAEDDAPREDVLAADALAEDGTFEDGSTAEGLAADDGADLPAAVGTDVLEQGGGADEAEPVVEAAPAKRPRKTAVRKTATRRKKDTG